MVNTMDYDFAIPPEAPVDPFDLSREHPAVREEMERDIRGELEAQAVVATYERLKVAEVHEAKLDRYYEAHKAVLQDAGVRHYPLLSATEKTDIDAWLDMERRSERSAVRQAFFNKHGDLIARRYLRENADYGTADYPD